MIRHKLCSNRGHGIDLLCILIVSSRSRESKMNIVRTIDKFYFYRQCLCKLCGPPTCRFLPRIIASSLIIIFFKTGFFPPFSLKFHILMLSTVSERQKCVIQNIVNMALITPCFLSNQLPVRVKVANQSVDGLSDR